MFQKIKRWWKSRKLRGTATSLAPEPAEPDSYTRAQVEAAYELGRTDGRREGLELAKQQAINSLKQVLKQQNRQ